MKFLYFCTILLPIVFVPEGQATPILGGKNASIAEYPFFVYLEKYNILFCGGAIVSDRHVLTAAHCIQGDFSGWYVRAGSHMVGQGGDLHLVHRFEPHPEFQRDLARGHVNDIGIITVCVPFRLNTYFHSIKMFNDGEPIKPDSVAMIVGAGKTLWETVPAQLQELIVPVVDQAQCHEHYKLKRVSLQPGTFCTGYEKGGMDTCDGDSGGPVIIGGRLAGLVSFGIGCGLPKLPGVNTEVSTYRKWIYQRIGV